MQGLYNSQLIRLTESRNRTFFGSMVSGTKNGTEFFSFSSDYFSSIFNFRLIMPTLRHSHLVQGDTIPKDSKP